jgi:bromodomain adjacent to zinc finger domain protein 1A
MAEVHACLINALIADLSSGAEPIRPIGIPVNHPAGGEDGGVGENDTDYWEGTRGATTETLRPIADDLALSWFTQPIPTSRKGWETSLVGLLWDRGTLASLPSYLDNILYLTYEDKPAPTRPTWATAPPSQSSLLGLIPSKPEKRWVTLHHTMKLDILGWMIELVMQTGLIRDFMEESMTALTEVRKVQVDVKREWKKLYVRAIASLTGLAESVAGVARH